MMLLDVCLFGSGSSGGVQIFSKLMFSFLRERVFELRMPSC